MNAKAKLMIRFRQNTPPMRDQDIVYAGDEASQEGDADGRALADYMNAIIDGVGGNSRLNSSHPLLISLAISPHPPSSLRCFPPVLILVP